MLLLADGRLEERRRLAAPGAPLAPLFDSLASELAPLLERPWEIPKSKALLSRAGGRCERDGTMLEFDPWSPHVHRCPRCSAEYRGELHDRWWVMSYQLWLAERAVHAALFHLLRGAEHHAQLARDILRGLAAVYREYPNRDNVLGPTRLFFSTYLESIWLLQICVAADLLEESGDVATAEIARDRIIAPSSALIAQYDEGMSNRQVWNNAALIAAASMLRDTASLDRRVHDRSGLKAHFAQALLADGTWYEGENYHQFALRGLWYGVTLAETRGVTLDGESQRRFARAFETPFLTALPDFTMPSRKDSQYAVSLRQWRMAELAELGYARAQSPALAAALARCYETGRERGDTGRWRSTADVERNGPPVALTRADLGWRALLHASPTLARAEASAPRSTLLEQQGLAVFRRPDDVYVALDYGEYGGGHGHPDRLNVLLAHGLVRWLDDLGTGSYVDPSLHWYRSTLAHNAPLVNGRSQPERDGTLVAYDERGGLGWVVASFEIPNAGVKLERAVVVAHEYMLDELRWTAADDVRVELPWHFEASASQLSFQPMQLEGSDGLEDGFRAVDKTYATQLVAKRPVVLEGRRVGRPLQVTLVSDEGALLFLGSAPGQPPTVERPFYLIRGEGKSGRLRAVLAWSPNVAGATMEGDAIVVASGDERHVHRRDDSGWHVELHAGGARSSIDLSGWRSPTAPQPDAPPPAPMMRGGIARRPVPDGWWTDLKESGHVGGFGADLGERNYRRSEQSWSEAGCPRARIVFSANDRSLVVFAHVVAGDPRFVAADATNELDNEHPDTMGAGLQLYVRDADRRGGWMLIPDSGNTVRVRPIDGWTDLDAPTARWRPTPEGYELRIELPLATPNVELGVDVIVNETTNDRRRRRGQLVMSGAAGEFVYLRGDRHDASKLIPLSVMVGR